jgi:hypothetical protein
MSDAEDPKLQFRVLHRQFLFRVVDVELLSAHAVGDANKLLGQLAALLVLTSACLGLIPLFMDNNMTPRAFLDLKLGMEHQLISLTMLVVGLFAVLSWESIFPDRRDVMILLPLAVPVRTMFLAKAAATATALGLVVISLHCVAGLTWPFAFAMLTPSSSRLFGVVRWFLAYWFTMFAAGAFVYFGLLTVQGFAAQVLPRRLFLRDSALLQMVAFCLFATMYGLQQPVAWFQALLGRLAGSENSLLAPLAWRAWLALTVTALGAMAAYALSYARTIRQIVEEPEITPSPHPFRWLPRFGNRMQTAIGQFSVRTLARSRQHRLILAFHLGIGWALTVPLLALLAMPQPGGAVIEIRHRPNAPMLGANIMMLALLVLGLRVAFAFPVELRANWIFRAVGVHDPGEILAASRRVLLLLSVAPVLFVSAAVCFWLWPWPQAAAHVAVVGLLGTIIVNLALYDFRKIPFACSYLPGKMQVHMVVAAAAVLLLLVAQSVLWEQEALQKPASTAAMLMLLAVVAVVTSWRVRVHAKSAREELKFEEADPAALLDLGLSRDGGIAGTTDV